jgi:hypothetical protein
MQMHNYYDSKKYARLEELYFYIGDGSIFLFLPISHAARLSILKKRTVPISF